jgi:lysozyme
MTIRHATLAILLGAACFSGAAGAQTFQTRAHIPSQSLIEDLAEPPSLGAANATPPRAMTALGVDVVKDFEGWVAMPYDDPVGYCTVGYGHLIEKKRCAEINPLAYAAGLTTVQGTDLLERDTRSARRAVTSMVRVELTDDQYSALASLVFNIGRDNFRTSTILELINSNQLPLAARQFRRWIKADGQILPGLITRRSCEETLFRGDLSYNAVGQFDRDACSTLGAAATAAEAVDIRTGER